MIGCDFCGFQSDRGSLFRKASDETIQCLDCYMANLGPGDLPIPGIQREENQGPELPGLSRWFSWEQGK